MTRRRKTSRRLVVGSQQAVAPGTNHPPGHVRERHGGGRLTHRHYRTSVLVDERGGTGARGWHVARTLVLATGAHGKSPLEECGLRLNFPMSKHMYRGCSEGTQAYVRYGSPASWYTPCSNPWTVIPCERVGWNPRVVGCREARRFDPTRANTRGAAVGGRFTDLATRAASPPRLTAEATQATVGFRGRLP